MALEFKLPDIGEGLTEGEIVEWLVEEGAAVEEHQPVLQVMTDKATVEIPAPKAGTLTKHRVKAGDIVPVGTVLFELEDSGDARAGKARPAAKASAEEPRSARPAAAPEKAEKPAKKSPASVESAPPIAPAARGRGGVLEFKLPDIGEGLTEGEIVRWLVEEGTAVEEHQPIVEVMTDKATVEIPAPAAGTLVKHLVEPGSIVPIGTALFRLETAAGASARDAEPAAASKSAAAPAAQAPATSRPAAPARGDAPAGGRGAPSGAPRGSKVRAVPSARRVARELGIDLSEVPPTGRSGAVRRKDVEAFHERRGAAPAAPSPSRAATPPAAAQRVSMPPVSIPVGERETRVPFRGLRRKIAEAMTRSKHTAAHFTVVEELDVTELVRLREKAKEIGAKKGIKVTYMPFIMKACARALFEHLELNASLDESTNELVTYHYVNLGIATDTKNGLIVPVIRDVQSKGMLQLAAELGELAERTRDGKVKAEELQGGTFTITNAGNIGGTLATPIINFPEVAVLGVHRIVKRPGVVETPDGDKIEVRHYMNLSVSVDHRLADGASAARFLVLMKDLLENPGLLAL